MGEKLLAQRILLLLRANVGRGSRAATATLDWALEQSEWLWPDRKLVGPASRKKGERLRWESLAELAGAIDTTEAGSPLFDCVETLARLLELDPFESEVLKLGVALARLSRLAALRTRLPAADMDLAALIGMLAGAESGGAAARVRRSAPIRLGLLLPVADGGGGLDLLIDWRLARLIDDSIADEEMVVATLAGRRQAATLAPRDFPERAAIVDLLVRLLRGALARKASGVNLLIHGPPGTGKTEFARMLAAAAGAGLFAVGESDEDGEEPSRYERLHALQRAQRLLARRGDSLLLFDEMEDLFAEAQLAAGGGRRAGSKIFVNRLLEDNKVPTIWTSNSLDLDPAHLRRLTYVLKMDHPGPRARARILARIAESEGADEAVRGLAGFVPKEVEAAAVARVSLQAAGLAGGGAEDAAAIAASLLCGLRGGRPLAPEPDAGGLALDLYDPGIGELVERVTAPGAASDFSLLLTGPPGTGKTVLAAHLAERLDRPLSVKRASDLLSKWVGGTEANIAEAFAGAREDGSVLLFDEVDSLLLDRADARHSWEITQVNELLTWMDCHPLPFIAATNYARRLDPAALRRFVFKLELAPLSAEAAATAWRRFFGQAPPAGLRVMTKLTPGDFALVRRQLRYRREAGPAEILALLQAELKAKPESGGRIGF